MTAIVPASPDDAAALLLDVLAAACPGRGEVQLIGSMARPGEADAVSDIDLRWSVPESEAPRLLRSLRSTLHDVGTVESLRVDPAERTDEVLVFVRFDQWPLWWRVDLEVHAPGAHAIGVPDADPWSPEESACMGVVVTLKALARRQLDEAEADWALALERVDATDVPGDWRQRIDALLDRLATSRLRSTDLVDRTRLLAAEVLGE